MSDGTLRIPEEIQRRFTLAEHPIEIPGLQVSLLKPRNFDDLISEADYVRDERLPYWADLWASSEVLALYMLERGGSLKAEVAANRPAQALEFGCGLGLVALAAERVGFTVLATDYYDDALLFAAHNGERANGRPLATRMVDWTAMPTDLGSYPLVIAADVLYEMRYAPILADALVQTLAPGGVFVLADQGRIALEAFLEETATRGLEHRITHRVPAPPGVAKPNITIYEMRWKA